MVKKLTFFAVFFCLILSNLVFAQESGLTQNPYLNFNPEKLKENKDYIKNFAPNNFKHSIFYACIHDIVDAARAEYTFAPIMKREDRLDSTATMQADYQAEQEKKTTENMAPYRFLDQRLHKYGLSIHANEVVSKAKAYLGEQEYSYYDVCLELVKGVLKNIKSAGILLDRKYSYLGFGYAFDQNMKNVYASFVLANDLVFNDGKPAVFTKDVPYTRSRMGLAKYDEQLCKKCMNDKNIEMLSSCLSVQGDQVYISCDDMKTLKKVMGKEEDAIVLDFVQHSQYECDGFNNIDYDRPNHGYMTKIITYADMVARNEASGKKNTKIVAPIAVIPEELPDNADYDINIIIVKDGKYVCRNVIKKKVECKNANFKEKMCFLKDESTIKTSGEWVPSPESNTFSVTIPFEDKKFDYTINDIAPYFSNLNEPAFTVDKVEIIVSNSLNFVGDATAAKNQKRRGESISKATKGYFSNNTFETTITYDDSWETFKKDIVNDEVYYDMSFMTKQEAVAQLKANGGAVAKLLEENFLKKHRNAKIVLHVTYKTTGADEQNYVVTKFNRSLAAKKTSIAMSIQKYMMKQVENKKYNYKAVTLQEIPNKKEYQPFLINRIYMQNVIDGDVTDKTAHDMIEATKLDLTGQIAQYNKVMAEVASGAAFVDINDITNRQAAIDRLYSLLQLPQDMVNNLNLEFQFQIINYLKNAPKSNENILLLENTYTKIKAIRNPVMSSWQNAYKLAEVFYKYGDYAYAVSLMEPFLTNNQISNDFLFSYISLAATREDLYMSGSFAKAVELAAQKDSTRLCNLFDNLPVIIFDNMDVKNIICKTCNK